MIRHRQTLFLVIVLLLVSCRPNTTNDRVTPTPFSSTRNPLRPPLSESIPISLSNLAANPEFFEGATLQLSGEYKKLPVLSCREDPHLSPATWGVVGEGLLANATGHDTQITSLLADNQPITVEGRWLRYTGPVGCGKSASVQEVWYLNVSRIISPHPLVRDPQGEPIGTVVLTEIASVPEDETEPLPTDTISITGTQTVVPTDPAANVTETPSVPSPTPSLTQIPGLEPTQGATTLTPTPIPPSILTSTPIITATGSITTTSTGTPGSTATPGSETATPQPTASSSPSAADDFNNRGSINFEDLRISTLEEGVPDRWTLTIDNATSITITTAPDPSANLIISIIDESGTKILDSQNQAGQGQVETVTNFSIDESGLYRLQVENQNGAEADYGLMALDETSYSFIFKGNLTSASPQNETLQEDNDHFWFFSLTSGETFSLRVTPNNQADPYLEIYDPNGSRLDAIDQTDTGETELIQDFEALSDGMYSIRVGEFDFARMSYEILLTK